MCRQNGRQSQVACKLLVKRSITRSVVPPEQTRSSPEHISSTIPENISSPPKEAVSQISSSPLPVRERIEETALSLPKGEGPYKAPLARFKIPPPFLTREPTIRPPFPLRKRLLPIIWSPFPLGKGLGVRACPERSRRVPRIVRNVRTPIIPTEANTASALLSS